MITREMVSKVFGFVRGAVRGLNGREDFRNLKFLIVGTDGDGLELIRHISSAPDASVYFTNSSGQALRQYQEVLGLDPSIQYWTEEGYVDVVIDNVNEKIFIGPREFYFTDLEEDSYTQGIHEFYL